MVLNGGKKGSRAQKSALEVAVAMLARREHSRAELAQKLRQKGFGAAEIAAALDELVARNYLNDGRFALVRAGYRAEHSKWGPVKIRQELAARGVRGDEVGAALAAAEEAGGDWLKVAKGLLARKFKEPLVMDSIADGALGGREVVEVYNKEKARRVGFLLRRGFTMAQALAAVGGASDE